MEDSRQRRETLNRTLRWDITMWIVVSFKIHVFVLFILCGVTAPKVGIVEIRYCWPLPTLAWQESSLPEHRGETRDYRCPALSPSISSAPLTNIPIESILERDFGCCTWRYELSALPRLRALLARVRSTPGTLGRLPAYDLQELIRWEIAYSVPLLEPAKLVCYLRHP